MEPQPLLPATAPFPDEHIRALNSVMAQSSSEQRAWLSGFLAGHQAAIAPAAASAPAAAPQPKIPLTILYATESGNSEGVAAEAKKAAGRLGFAARIVDMAETDPAAIARAGNLLVIASTWGEGDPPQRASDFYAALMAEDAPSLAGLRFAVLALGDTAYVNFCETGRRIDARLEALGATRVADRVECDLDYEARATGWVGGALDTLKALAVADSPADRAVIHVDFSAPAAEAPTHTRTNPFQAEITELVNLNGSRSGKETWHVELSLEGSGLTYEPGDAIGVVPANDPAVAEAVVTAVGLGGDDALAGRLAEAFDITTLTRPVVEAYGRLTGEPALAALSQSDDLPAWIAERQIVDLFEAYPHRLEPEQLTGLLRPLPARLYSVASSLEAAEGEAHLLIGKVRWESRGRTRTGVTSGFVAERRRAGDTLSIYVKPNRHFRLPVDPGRSIVMIGPGTGVAPFRGFLQKREAVGGAGPAWLFFGDRTYTHDFLYQLDWQDFLKSGALTRLDVAFSRDRSRKTYVQHRLWERRRDLYSWIEDGAHLYVCGDEKAMAKDVHATLRRVLAEGAGTGEEEAEARLSTLRREGRYQRDVY